MIVAGFGFRRGATSLSLRDALRLARSTTGSAAPDLVATADDRADAACLRGLADDLGLRIVAVPFDTLANTPTLTDSAAVRARRGTGSTAEAAALAVARQLGGPRARLLHPRSVSTDRLATCALAAFDPPS